VDGAANDLPTHQAAYVPFSRQGKYSQVVAANQGRGWGIQVGAYNRAPEAVMAAINAAKLANAELYGAKVMVSDAEDSSGDQVHRARLANIGEEQARRACQKLMSMQHSCFVVRMAQQESL
jgi:SPOR domain